MKWLSALFGRNNRGEGGGEEDEGLNRKMETGMEMEELSLVWSISNFPIIQMSDVLINLQRLKFSAGATIGPPSRWIVYLKAEKREGEKWIVIYYRGIDRASSSWVHLYTHSQMSFAIKDTAGVTTWSQRRELRSIFDTWTGSGFYMIDVAGSVPPETLEIHLTLKLYAPARKPQRTVASTLVKFHGNAAAKARKDLGGLVKNPIPGGDVKVVSGNKKEFLIPIGILAARSPVFEAMLRTNMTEATSGRIDCPDMTGKGLEVLLHFIYTGELPTGWKDSGVIVELTNAAAKYQFSDLLEFLDMTLGKVCNVRNVGPLLALAYQLSLKTAQEELLKFVKDNGVSSVESSPSSVSSHSNQGISSLIDD